MPFEGGKNEERRICVDYLDSQRLMMNYYYYADPTDAGPPKSVLLFIVYILGSLKTNAIKHRRPSPAYH